MKRSVRIVLSLCALFVPILCFAALRALGPKGGWLAVPCLLYHFTGLYCPGCGAYRALYALSHFKLWTAFCYNPCVTLLVPTGLYALARTLLAFIKGARYEPPVKVLWSILAALFAFGVLRNIPFFPFTLLAPGGMLGL